MVPECSRYADFWPHYLAEHSHPVNRALHYLGSSLGLALLAAAAILADWRLLPAALVAGYAFAWVGHFRVERNKPATFGYPLWSFVSDFRMLALAATGRLAPELARHGITPSGLRGSR